MARWRVCLFLLFPLANAQSGRRSRFSRVHDMDGRDEGSENLLALANQLGASDVKSNPLHGSGANNVQESSNMGGEQTSTQWSSSTTTAGTTFVSVALPKVVSTELVVSTTHPAITWTAPAPAQPSTSVPSSTVSTPSSPSLIISFTASPNPSPPSGSNNNNLPNPAPSSDSPSPPSSKSTTTTSLTVLVTTSASPASNPTSSSSPSTPLDLSLPAAPSSSAPLPTPHLSASKKASIGIGITLAVLTLCGLLVLLSFLQRRRRRHRRLQQKQHQHDAKTENFTTTTDDDDDETLPPRSPNFLTATQRTVSTFSPFLQTHFASLIAKVAPARRSLSTISSSAASSSTSTTPPTSTTTNPNEKDKDDEAHFSILSASHVQIAHKGHGSIRSIRTRGSSASSLLSPTTQKRNSASSVVVAVGEDGLLHPGSASAPSKGKRVVEEVRRRLDVALTGNPVSPPPTGERERWPLVE